MIKKAVKVVSVTKWTLL